MGRHFKNVGTLLTVVVFYRNLLGLSDLSKKLCGRSFSDVRPGGLGLHFILDGVDVMQYKRQARRNQLRLVKYLPGAEARPPIAKGE